MVTLLFNICRRSEALTKLYINLSDPEFMTAVVFGNTLLLLWLNCVCAAPAQSIETCCHHIKHLFNASDLIGDVPAGMKWLTCSFYTIHQCREHVLSSHAGARQSLRGLHSDMDVSCPWRADVAPWRSRGSALG